MSSVKRSTSLQRFFHNLYHLLVPQSRNTYHSTFIVEQISESVMDLTDLLIAYTFLACVKIIKSYRRLKKFSLGHSRKIIDLYNFF